MGFAPTYANHDMWLQLSINMYDYVVIHVDDLFEHKTQHVPIF